MVKIVGNNANVELGKGTVSVATTFEKGSAIGISFKNLEGSSIVKLKFEDIESIESIEEELKELKELMKKI